MTQLRIRLLRQPGVEVADKTVCASRNAAAALKFCTPLHWLPCKGSCRLCRLRGFSGALTQSLIRLFPVARCRSYWPNRGCRAIQWCIKNFNTTLIQCESFPVSSAPSNRDTRDICIRSCVNSPLKSAAKKSLRMRRSRRDPGRCTGLCSSNRR